MHIDLTDDDDSRIVRRITGFLLHALGEKARAGVVLNIAGSRASTAPGIYERVKVIVARLMVDG